MVTLFRFAKNTCLAIGYALSLGSTRDDNTQQRVGRRCRLLPSCVASSVPINTDGNDATRKSNPTKKIRIDISRRKPWPPRAAGTDEEGLPIHSEEQSKTAKPKEELSAAAGCCCFVLLALAVVGVVYISISVVHLLAGHWHTWFGPFGPVEYTVTIATASGIDLHGLPPPALLYPAFNLTLHVASPRTAKHRECVKPGTTVEVSYTGVLLATGQAPTFCVDVGERRDEGSVVAWGEGVRLPGVVLDSLAADMLRGAAAFGVKLTPLSDCGRRERLFCSDTVDVTSCWGAKVGGGPAPCSFSKERVSSFPPAVPPPGVRHSAANNLSQPTP